MANEAKEMCDWIKRENKLATLSFSKPCGLEVSYLIRNKILGVMTSILQGYIVENTFFVCRVGLMKKCLIDSILSTAGTG